MNIEGRLTIELERSGDGHRARIGSSRPLHAVRLFLGKTPEQVLSTLPLLYSICGTAQGCAAYRALAAAGAGMVPGVGGAHELLVWTETAREHLWRVLLDWPALLGESVDGQAAKPLAELLPGMRRALFAEAAPFAPEARPALDPAAAEAVIASLEGLLQRQVFGMPAAQWLEQELSDWAAEGARPAARLLRRLSERGWDWLGGSPVAALPELSGPQLARQLTGPDAAAFVAAPTWEGAPHETSTLTRQAQQPALDALHHRFGNGLATRLAARLVELARIPAQLRDGLSRLEAWGEAGRPEPVGEGSGLGQVEAARGRLVHQATLEGGRVSAYAILAPTEWNFHPEGAVARGLAALPPTDEATLREQAALLIQAVDPCVSYELVVRGEAHA